MDVCARAGVCVQYPLFRISSCDMKIITKTIQIFERALLSPAQGCDPQVSGLYDWLRTRVGNHALVPSRTEIHKHIQTRTQVDTVD